MQMGIFIHIKCKRFYFLLGQYTVLNDHRWRVRVTAELNVSTVGVRNHDDVSEKDIKNVTSRVSL